jgi:hypothetical protein
MNKKTKLYILAALVTVIFIVIGWWITDENRKEKASDTSISQGYVSLITTRDRNTNDNFNSPTHWIVEVRADTLTLRSDRQDTKLYDRVEQGDDVWVLWRNYDKEILDIAESEEQLDPEADDGDDFNTTIAILALSLGAILFMIFKKDKKRR